MVSVTRRSVGSAKGIDRAERGSNGGGSIAD